MYPNVIARYQNKRRPKVLKIVNMFLSQGDGEERCCGGKTLFTYGQQGPKGLIWGNCVTTLI